MTKSYPKVSILTPLHETSHELVERAFLSIKTGKYELENLEWVVVLHNCSKEYSEAFHERFDKEEFLTVSEVNMPQTGLAYARAKTLEKAKGEYIFFLDGDDELTPSCIRDAVEAMEDTGADIAAFSIWVKFGAGGIGGFCDADPSKGRLILDKGDERIGSTMCYSGVGVWSRGYRRSFLLDKGISFDESCPNHITDPVFNLDAALRASRIVILPQLMGYIYYYGIGMLKADGKNAAKDLLLLLDRYFEKYRQQGLIADNLMCFFLQLILLLIRSNVKDDTQRDYLKKVKEYSEKLDKPVMNWTYLQGGMNHICKEIKKATEEV